MNSSIERPLSKKIDKNFLLFISPGMILSVLLLVVFCLVNPERIMDSYSHNPLLSSFITLITLYATFKVFITSHKLRKAAVFLQKIEAEESRNDMDCVSIQPLVNKLSREGSYLETQSMYTGLENLQGCGHLNFSEHDAALLKNKFTMRIKHERNAINYLTGLLLILGIMGAFLGLISTNDTVGETFDIGTTGPLDFQRMAITLSSTLVAIAASFYLGFLNFFSAQAQNSFIETVESWVDSRVPRLGLILDPRQDTHISPRSDDLKAWLAGFVHLSNKTNQQMGQIAIALSKSTEAMLKSAYQTEKIYDYQKDIFMSMERMSTRMSLVKESMQYISKSVDPSMRYSASIRDNLVQIKELMNHSNTANDDIAMQQLDKLGKLTNQMREINSTFQILSEVQSSLVVEIEKLREKSQKEDHVAQFANMVWQLNNIMEEIKQKNHDAYADVFERDLQSLKRKSEAENFKAPA